jgi:hypothetical protein
MAYESTGVLGPWEFPEDEEIIIIWNLIFGDDHPITSGDVNGELFLTVKTLVRHTLFTYVR